MHPITLLTLAACTLATTAPADPAPSERLENWHHWRGPDANGTAPRGDPPVKWDEQKNIKWKAHIPGRGSSTPIVWGDQVFVLTAVDTGRTADAADLPPPDPQFPKKTVAPTTYYQFWVISYDRATGRVRWQKKAAERVPHEGHHVTHSYAAGSPTTDGKFLYVSFGSLGTYCYDLEGKLQWQRDLGRLRTRLGWGEAVTPVIQGDSLLLNYDQEADSALICLEARTGKTKWKKARDEKTSWNTPLIVEHEGRTQVVLNGTNRVRGYDLETGQELWKCGGMTVNAIPSVVARQGVVYCMSGYQGSLACAIRLGGSGELTDSDRVAWRHTRGTPYVPSPLLVGDRLYFTQANNNLLTSLDIHTGKPILDRVRLPGLSSFYGSPVTAAGRIYLVDRDGLALVLKEGDRFEILATNQLADHFDASPAIAGKQLFLRGAEHLYCIEAE
jgi:outer membrane protein assembly factor BamB